MTFSGIGNPTICPRCGRQVKSGQKFCGFDGTAVGGSGSNPVETRTGDFRKTSPAGKICPACKTSYPDYAKFCPRDSVKLVDAGSGSLTRTTTTTGRVARPGTTAPGGDLAARMVADPFARLVGETIEGKYRLDSFIGEGGMAIVYKATQLNMDRPVVLKVMQWQLIGNERALKRFEQEAKFTAKVQHPNVVSVFDVGFVPGGQPYLVMEYIKGQSLRDRLEQHGALPVAEAMLLMIQVCRGLQEAHNAGLMHRDLKPENILLQEDRERPDWVKIVDFGIAHLVTGYERLTKTGNLTGTVAYMAPEQLKDIPVDTRADLYALGVVLFEALTGDVPFDGETTEAILLKQLLDKPAPVSTFRKDIPPGSAIDMMVAKAMEKDPARRYQTATEMRADCERILSQITQRQ